MKVTGETAQPVIIETDREDAKALRIELSDFDLIGKPRLREFYDGLIEVERRFKQQEYGGPG